MAPTVRSFSERFEPLGLVARFPEHYPGLFESAAAADGAKARYDILPISSSESLRLTPDGRVLGPHARADGGFLDALERWWSELRLAPAEGVQPVEGWAPGQALPTGDWPPFKGGWLVYLGYEIAAEIEQRLQLPVNEDRCIALALRTPAAWIRDRAAGRSWLVGEPGSESLLDRFEEHAHGVAPRPARDAPRIAVREEDPGRFVEAVRGALRYIADGEVYQANLSRRWYGESADEIDPVALYERLRASNPSPFAALLRDGDFVVISSSPERLLSIRDRQISTRPIAGTRPRGASAEADRALKRALQASEKERAEHIMLVDLERNDLGRVCCAGTVRVDEYMVVETYAHVHHIVSNVSGRLRNEISPIQAIRALFPGGTITGCPKVRCMQIIGELEGAYRGAYTGSLGYLNRDGSCDFNILIRTITATAHALQFRAGAGIVADSVPELELAETRAKAEGLLRAFAAPVPAP